MQTRHKSDPLLGFLNSLSFAKSPSQTFCCSLVLCIDCFLARKLRAPKTQNAVWLVECQLQESLAVALKLFQKMLDKVKKFPGLVSLQTVLESSSRDAVHGPVGDDDFELWDHSQMLRNQQRYKWNHGSVVCKPSCIPIIFILILIILVVLLPLLDSQNDKYAGRHNSSLVGWICHDECR